MEKNSILKDVTLVNNPLTDEVRFSSDSTKVGYPLSTTNATTNVDTFSATNVTNCSTRPGLFSGGTLGYGQSLIYPYHVENLLTVNKVANGYTAVLGNQTFVFQTVKQLTKFIEKQLNPPVEKKK